MRRVPKVDAGQWFGLWPLIAPGLSNSPVGQSSSRRNKFQGAGVQVMRGDGASRNHRPSGPKASALGTQGSERKKGIRRVAFANLRPSQSKQLVRPPILFSLLTGHDSCAWQPTVPRFQVLPPGGDQSPRRRHGERRGAGAAAAPQGADRSGGSNSREQGSHAHVCVAQN